jgi:hypothetical protein
VEAVNKVHGSLCGATIAKSCQLSAPEYHQRYLVTLIPRVDGTQPETSSLYMPLMSIGHILLAR